MSTAFNVAAAVAAELNAGAGSGFTAVTKTVPLVDIKDLGSPTVTVVPHAIETVAMTRTSKTKTVTVEVGIQQKVASDAPADCAGPAKACEDILDYLWGRALSTMPAARFVAASIEPVFDPEHLQKLLVFTGVVRVTYRV